jgi:hypothetical protein
MKRFRRCIQAAVVVSVCVTGVACGGAEEVVERGQPEEFLECERPGEQTVEKAVGRFLPKTLDTGRDRLRFGWFPLPGRTQVVLEPSGDTRVGVRITMTPSRQFKAADLIISLEGCELPASERPWQIWRIPEDQDAQADALATEFDTVDGVRVRARTKITGNSLFMIAN